MGTDIHAFVEYADDKGRRSFTGRPEEPAWFFGKFSLLRDYALFDALGDGRNSQLAPEDVGERALYSPRGVPPDLSLPAAWEYYDLVADAQAPHPGFWPKHGRVSSPEAQERVQRGAHFGSVAQTTHHGTTPPRTWQAASKDYWHTPSWLLLAEIHQALEHPRLPLTERRWDFRALLKCLAEIEEQIGRGQVRLVFWFDN
jgi:hypothetical protein